MRHYNMINNDGCKFLHFLSLFLHPVHDLLLGFDFCVVNPKFGGKHPKFPAEIIA